jgi:hypothetical protein
MAWPPIKKRRRGRLAAASVCGRPKPDRSYPYSRYAALPPRNSSILTVTPRLIIAVVVVSIASGPVIFLAILPVAPRLVILIIVVSVSRSLLLVPARLARPAPPAMAFYAIAIRTIISRLRTTNPLDRRIMWERGPTARWRIGVSCPDQWAAQQCGSPRKSNYRFSHLLKSPWASTCLFEVFRRSRAAWPRPGFRAFGRTLARNCK